MDPFTKDVIRSVTVALHGVRGAGTVMEAECRLVESTSWLWDSPRSPSRLLLLLLAVGNPSGKVVE